MTNKTICFKSPKLFRLINKFVDKSGWNAQIDTDFLRWMEVILSEANPRFGGGYLHAYEFGWDHLKLIIKNFDGKENRTNIRQYEEGDLYDEV